MSMAEKEITSKTEIEIAASGDNIPPQEPKIYESGYFYLSQQINDLRDRMDAKFDRVDARFESMKRDTDARFEAVHKEIKDLSDKTDARFDKVDAKLESMRKETDARFDGIEDKVDNLNKWTVGSVIAVMVGTISVIVTLLLK
ncbi:MAG: hypothetical protein PHE70_06610 [Tepidanaerobacteraceae bacterium]|nr:hypothetical protein [Tepidanaerobacteraceae bacterium]